MSRWAAVSRSLGSGVGRRWRIKESVVRRPAPGGGLDGVVVFGGSRPGRGYRRGWWRRSASMRLHERGAMPMTRDERVERSSLCRKMGRRGAFVRGRGGVVDDRRSRRWQVLERGECALGWVGQVGGQVVECRRARGAGEGSRVAGQAMWVCLDRRGWSAWAMLGAGVADDLGDLLSGLLWCFETWRLRPSRTGRGRLRRRSGRVRGPRRIEVALLGGLDVGDAQPVGLAPYRSSQSQRCPGTPFRTVADLRASAVPAASQWAPAGPGRPAGRARRVWGTARPAGCGGSAITNRGPLTSTELLQLAQVRRGPEK